MLKMNFGRWVLCTALITLIPGCYHIDPDVRLKTTEKDYYRALPPGKRALRKITDIRDIPNFTQALREVDNLREAVDNSINYMNKASSKRFFPVSGIDHHQVKTSLAAFRDILDSSKSAAEKNGEVRKRFDVYTSIGCDDKGTMLFTGYYTPIFEASNTKTTRFVYPLHKLPANHVKDVVTGETLGRRTKDGKLDPNYPDRRTLMSSGELDGHELVWLSDPFKAYVTMVQGSAVLRMTDGKQMEIGYAGNNGHDYTSISMELVKSGKMKRENLNLRSMIEYFEKNPQDFEPLASKNKRYVFFQESSGGPFGTINEQVLPLRSIATDKSIFPRASLCFISTSLPSSRSSKTQAHQGFVLDQDAGGAIRAPGRCDIYMGTGKEAGQRAGRVFAEGRMYYLILKGDDHAMLSR